MAGKRSCVPVGGEPFVEVQVVCSSFSNISLLMFLLVLSFSEVYVVHLAFFSVQGPIVYIHCTIFPSYFLGFLMGLVFLHQLAAVGSIIQSGTPVCGAFHNC